MSVYKNYIFDFDGTLAHTAPEVLECFKKAFAKAGCPLETSEVKDTLLGPPLETIIQQLRPSVPEEMKQNVVRAFREIYDCSTTGLTKLYPGMRKTLEELRSRGAKIFIATNKPLIPVNRLLKELNIDFFNGVYTVNSGAARMSKAEMIAAAISGHNLQKEETLMIGDTMSDINAGLANGIDTAAAMWGYATDEGAAEMRKKAVHVIESAGEILCL